MPDPDETSSPALSVQIDEPEHSAHPGERVVFNFTTANRSEEPQSQAIALEGLPEDWVTVDYDQDRQAFPGEQRGGALLVRIPEDATAALYAVELTVRADAHVASAHASLRVISTRATTAGSDARRAPGVALRPEELTGESGQARDHSVTLTIRNVEDVETSYVVSVYGLPETWIAAPGVIRVPAMDSLDLPLQVRVPASARSDAYPFVVHVAPEDQPALAGEAEARLTLRPPSTVRQIEVDAERPLPDTAPPAVNLDPTEFMLAPGQVIDQATLTIQNTTGLRERYGIEVSGLAAGWYDLSAREIQLEPGAAQQVMLRVTPKPDRDQPAGEYSFAVRVTPRSAAGAFAEVGGRVAVEGLQSFDARVAPLQVTGRRETFKITLRNTGTLPVSLWVEGTDPAGMCRFDFPSPPHLDPGREEVLRVKVGARRNRVVGRVQSLDFGLRVLPAGEGSTAARSFDARLVHQPYMTPRMLKWTLLGALAVILVGVFVGIGPPRFADGFSWVRCRVQLGGVCPDPVPRLPRLTASMDGPADLPGERGAVAVRAAAFGDPPDRGVVARTAAAPDPAPVPGPGAGAERRAEPAGAPAWTVGRTAPAAGGARGIA